MATPNLGIIHIAAAQNQKEVTANTAFDDLDLALTNFVIEPMSDAGFIVPPLDAVTNMVFRFVGSVTANRGVTLPSSKKLYIIQNQTNGSPLSSLVFGTSSSPTGRVAIIPADQVYYILYCDGVNVDIISPVQSGGSTINGVLPLSVSYFASVNDSGKFLYFNSPSAQTLSLPATPPIVDWFIIVKNIGPGAITILRNGRLIDTLPNNIVLGTGGKVMIFTDGTNYFSF